MIPAGGVNCYLIGLSTRRYILVDTGFAMRRKRLSLSLLSAGCTPGRLALIFITHGDFDHIGNAAYIRREFGSKIAMHANDTGMAERADMFWNRKKKNALIKTLAPIFSGFRKSDHFTPDLLLEDGDDLSTYGLAAKVMYLPGHSSGSIGFLTGDGDLFCGDLLMNDKSGPHLGYGDPGDFTESLKRLENLDIRKVYPGHGQPFPMDQFFKINK